MRESPRLRALDDAKRIIENLIIEIGVTSEGWAVDILCHSLSHLLAETAGLRKHPIPADLFDSWSAVEAWDTGVLRTSIPKPRTTIQ